MKTKIPSISFDLTLRKTDNKKLSTKFSILGLLVSFWCWCLFSPIQNDVGGGVCSFSWTKSRSLPTKNSKRWRHQHQRSQSKRRSGKIRESPTNTPTVEEHAMASWEWEYLRFPQISTVVVDLAGCVCVCALDAVHVLSVMMSSVAGGFRRWWPMMTVWGG